MGSVYAGVHEQSGLTRAVKIMRSPGSGVAFAEARRRFWAEQRALSGLQHPAITRVYEAGTHGGLPWFAMDLLRGVRLLDLVEPWRALPAAERFGRVQSLVTQVAHALGAVHARGLVHRDVTPANLLVEELEGGRVTVHLADFGAAHGPGEDPDQLVGTLPYSAPEQLTGGTVDARTDLYALGAVLYLVLTGRRPFLARTLPGYVDKHLHQRPQRPRELDPAVPAHWDAVCMRLLEKEPDNRFGSALHLLATLDRAAAGVEDLALAAWPAWPVGRTRVRARLRERMAALHDGEGGAVLLEAPAGFGKSLVLAEVALRASEAGLPLSPGRCRRNPRAFGGFHEVFASLAAELGPGEAVHPVLHAAFHEDTAGLERYPVLVAFRDLLQAHLPRVVVLDQVHRADAGTLDLLAYLLRNLLQLVPRPVLFVMARRPDQPGGEALEQVLEGVDVERIAIDALSVAGVEELLVQLLPAGPETRRLAERLHHDGDGAPATVQEMVRILVEEGVIRRAPGGGWEHALGVSEIGRARLPLPTSQREALVERLSSLSASATTLARLLALAGDDTPEGLLAEVFPGDLESALGELSRAGVASCTSDPVVRWSLSRPRLVDLLQEGLRPQSAAELHRKLGEARERLYRKELEPMLAVLAWHFEQARLPAKAYPYLVRTGLHLAARSLVREALEVFDRAVALEPEARALLPLDDADHRLAELQLSRGRILAHLGRWEESVEVLRHADDLARLVGDPRLRARTAAELATHQRRHHQPDHAQVAYSEALHLADRLGDVTLRLEPLYGLGALAWERGDLEEARRLWAECQASAARVQDARLEAMSYNGLGLEAFCRGQGAEARRYLERSAELLERLGQEGTLAVTLSNLVELSHSQGNLRKGLELAERALARAREVSHREGMALGLRHRAFVLTDLGRLREAEENARASLEQLRDLDQPGDEIGSLVALFRVPLARGEYAVALPLVERSLALVDAFDTEGFGPVLQAWRARCLAALGSPAEDVAVLLGQALADAHRSWPHQLCRLELTAARTWQLLGRTADARVSALRALGRADSCGFRLYSLKAQLLLAGLHESPEANPHLRVARALAESLAANLTRPDRASFLAGLGLAQAEPRLGPS